MPTLELAASDPMQVGPFRLRGRLGSGGMGVVYLADAPDGRPVAVKCLPHGVGGEVRARLQREAEFLSTVRHRRVARFVASDVRADRPWVAMQFIAGPSLAQAAVPLGPAQLRHLAEGLAEALQALHRQGLTHRDVKPGNIILTRDGPVLVDLGIASGGDLTSLTVAGMVVGTPEWMAPEQLGGYPSGPFTDTWGWACVLTYAATRHTPFGAGPIVALAHRIRFEAPDLRGVPDWLRGAVAAGLAKNPRDRPAAAALTTAAAIQAVRPAGTLAHTPPPRGPLGTRPQASVGRHPLWVPAAHRPLPPAPHRPLPVANRSLPRAASPTKRKAAGPVRTNHATARRAAKPGPVPPSMSRRRATARRLRRTLVVFAVVVLLALLVGVGAYILVWHHVHGGSWIEPLRRLADRFASG